MKVYAYGKVYGRAPRKIKCVITTEELKKIVDEWEVDPEDPESRTLHRTTWDTFIIYDTLLSEYGDDQLTPRARLERLKALKGDERFSAGNDDAALGFGLTQDVAKLAFAEMDEDDIDTGW